jgi:hypothetical protein
MVTSGHATLSTLFAAAVARQLEPQDAMVLVPPAAWTDTRSARELRAGLWSERLRPLELHRSPTRTRAFTGPSVTATVVGLGARRDRPRPFVHGIARADSESVAISERRSVKYLADARAIEAQALQLLEKSPKLAGASELASAYEEHREETEVHQRLIAAGLDARGSEHSRLKDAALRWGAVARSSRTDLGRDDLPLPSGDPGRRSG